jgi:hypothetical protein
VEEVEKDDEVVVVVVVVVEGTGKAVDWRRNRSRLESIDLRKKMKNEKNSQNSEFEKPLVQQNIDMIKKSLIH